jgi:hypothetical protein
MEIIRAARTGTRMEVRITADILAGRTEARMVRTEAVGTRRRRAITADILAAAIMAARVAASTAVQAEASTVVVAVVTAQAVVDRMEAGIGKSWFPTVLVAAPSGVFLS